MHPVGDCNGRTSCNLGMKGRWGWVGKGGKYRLGLKPCCSERDSDSAACFKSGGRLNL